MALRGHFLLDYALSYAIPKNRLAASGRAAGRLARKAGMQGNISWNPYVIIFT